MMKRQSAAVARLNLSRRRLRLALVDSPSLGSAGTLLGQLVQRHPVLATALAALAGGLLSSARPWRWLLRAETWSALLPSVLAALASAPLSGWAEVLAALLRQTAAAANTDTAPPA